MLDGIYRDRVKFFNTKHEKNEYVLFLNESAVNNSNNKWC